MRYSEATKKYFASKGLPVSFPKKGSDEYNAIRTIMSESAAAAQASGNATANSAVSAQAAPLEKKVRKARAKKESVAKAPGAPQDTPTKAGGHTTLLDQPHITKQSVAEVVPDSEEKPKKKRDPRAVQRDGLTPQEDLLRANAVENGSMAVMPAAFPGLKEQIEKVLEVAPEGVPASNKKEFRSEIAISKTTEGKKTPDVKAIQGRAPFSFQAVKYLLRQ